MVLCWGRKMCLWSVLHRIPRVHPISFCYQNGPMQVKGSPQVRSSIECLWITTPPGIQGLLLAVHPKVLGVDNPSHYPVPQKHVSLWSPEAQQTFKQLKLVFTTAPILVHLNTMQAFTIKADASHFVIWTVLSQKHGLQQLLHPCTFYSRALTSTEQNRRIWDKELLAIKTSFEERCHYLEGA